uniref:Ig-like domain-containing protein n=1 Tax=Cyprinus carpio carpio TaxID=630221 RepID=A0A9J7Y6M0_CYPCA
MELLKKMFHMFVLFCLCWWRLIGAFAVDMKSVVEGESVLLHSDVTEIREDDDMLWTFGKEDSLIAKINREEQIFSIFDVPDGRFSDRLKLDDTTGSLTITNITTQHAGLYQLDVFGAEHSSKVFSVSVNARLSVPVISSNSLNCSSSSSSSSSSSQQNCSLLCSVLNVGHVTLSWYKGNSLLSSISVSDLSISLSLPLEVEYQDKNSYSCVINNSFSKQTRHLNISQLCWTCYVSADVLDQSLPSLNMMLISAAAAAGSLLIVAAAVTYLICMKCKKTVQEEDRTDSALCKPKSQKVKSRKNAVYENVPKKR